MNRNTRIGKLMKSTIRSLITLALVLAFVPWRSHAQNLPSPPGQVSYQGFLTDANGIPLATNNPINYTINFGIWDSSTGGSNLWLEQQVVTVDRGYFTVLLGNGSSIGGPNTNNLTGIFSGANAGNRYLEITVLGLAAGDLPIAPRLRFLASPYSYLASQALSVAGTNSVPDSSLSTNIALRTGGNPFFGAEYFNNSGAMYFDNSYRILGKNSSGIYEDFLWPRYADNVTYLNYGANGFSIRNDASAGEMFIANNGYVGLGSSFNQNALPFAPLSFASVLGEKISLWNGGSGSFGFGIQGSQLQIHTDVSASDIVFGSGPSASLTETMRIKGNGSVGIGTSSPQATFHVASGGFPSALIDSSSTAGTWADLRNTSAGGTNWLMISTGSGNGGGPGNLLFQPGSAPNSATANALTLTPKGSVGIGTISPGAALDIEHAPNTSVAQDSLFFFGVPGDSNGGPCFGAVRFPQVALIISSFSKGPLSNRAAAPGV
jgi:hypothetical protein